MPRPAPPSAVTEPKRGRGRPVSPERRAARRRAIVRSAYAVLTERGYEQTSISDIARHARVGQGTVYRHFPSKRDLLDHVFDYAVVKAVRGLDMGSLKQIDAADAHARILALLDTLGTRLFALVDRDPAILRLITVESSAIDPELRLRVIGLFAALDAEVARRCEKAEPELAATVDRTTFELLGRVVTGMVGPGLAIALAGHTDPDARAAVLSTSMAIADRGLLSAPAEHA